MLKEVQPDHHFLNKYLSIRLLMLQELLPDRYLRLLLLSLRYYTTVGNSVDIPIIMYNVPGRTGTNIQPATAVKIAKSVDNIVAIKEASGDIGQVATLAALADGCFVIVWCYD